MRAPISLKTLYLSYVGKVASQYIALPGTLDLHFQCMTPPLPTVPR